MPVDTEEVKDWFDSREVDTAWSHGISTGITHTSGVSPIDTRVYYLNDTTWAETRGTGSKGAFGSWKAAVGKLAANSTWPYGPIAATSWGVGSKDARIELFYVDGFNIREVMWNDGGKGEWSVGRAFA